MSKKRQRCALVNIENNFSILAKFTDVVSNNYRRISDTIEDKAFLLECYFQNGVNRQPIKHNTL
jgi:hypothetical protein